MQIDHRNGYLNHIISLLYFPYRCRSGPAGAGRFSCQPASACDIMFAAIFQPSPSSRFFMEIFTTMNNDYDETLEHAVVYDSYTGLYCIIGKRKK
uniref:Uncharacterized protein n=1 Tax=Romanomermis culicivorax TaxID=13658 RepID=A0A915JPW2_ROMCU